MATVMIAEDDLLMADMLEESLIAGGYAVCGIARTVEQAIALGEHHKPDLAILDLALANGGCGTEIAARLRGQGRMGILYASGHGSHNHLTIADGDALIVKPYRAEDVVRGLRIVERIVSTGETDEPFPGGFTLLNGLPHDGSVASRSDEIRKLRRQQEALAAFGSFALGESDLGKVLTEAARVCAASLGVPFCKICRYRTDENDLLVEAGIGWHAGVIGEVVSRADETSPQGRAFTTGLPVICDDLSKDTSFVLPSFYAEHGIISTVDVVIKKEGQPYGVLEIDSPTQHNYDQHDINFLTGFANVIAEAVNTGKRNAALQSAVARMQDMVADKDRLLLAKSAVLEERGVLARELQHRVRNNLQLVFGMLSRQIEMTTDPAGIEGMGAIARRVMALAQVYEHLLGTGLSRTIDFGRYLTSLCSSFQALEGTEHPRIGLTCDAQPMTLDLDMVTALGLITSELVANSYAHAFPTGDGSISVSAHSDQITNVATLVFSDDGIGFSEAAGSKRHGVGLVRRLMEQIGGSATVVSDHGTNWTLTFPLPQAVFAPVP
ncbi:MAG: histidine kinase dimerization/phosphoacceptor domain -containing protein [Acetobacteraceae bacterium]